MGENTPFTKQSKEKGAGQGSRHPLKKENTDRLKLQQMLIIFTVKF